MRGNITSLIDKMHSYLDKINQMSEDGKLGRIHLADLDSCEFSLRELINDVENQSSDADNDMLFDSYDDYDDYDDLLDIDY